jgi:PDZ domain-containing protein
MVTPTDPEAHGPDATSRASADDGQASPAAAQDGPPEADPRPAPGAVPPRSDAPVSGTAPASDGASPPGGPTLSGPAPPSAAAQAPSDAPVPDPAPPTDTTPAPSDAPGSDAAPPSDGASPPGGPPGLPAVVPLAGDQPPRSQRRTRRVVLGIVAFLLTAFLLGAAFVPLPYYLFKPGSVRDTEPLIAVEGTEVFASDGSISYTTVSLRQATLMGLVQGWLDDDIDVYGRDRVLQGRDVDENRELNLQLMSDSKQVATQVALERLGYDVDVTIGQVVAEVVPDMPADGVLERGDTITAIDGEPFDDAQDLGRLLGDDAPGDTVTATVQSPTGSAGRDVELTLAASPDDPAKGVMGVQVVNVVLDYNFPVDVEIDTGDVGGPSAGLAFTLAIIDDLTPGELTGGSDIAVTGTISGDGTVGPVGGTGQKAAAVRDVGIRLFLVPRDDYQAAVDHAGDDLDVVAVDTLDDALAALEERGGNVDELPPAGESAAAPTG